MKEKWRTIVERERTLKADLPYELPSSLDGELRYHVAEIINAAPNKATLNRTPTEIVTHIKPILKDYAFGQPGLFYHSSPKTDPSMPNADYGIITGFNKDARNKYRIYVPFMKAMLSRGSFQLLPTIPPEWGWPLRLRSVPPRVIRTNTDNILQTYSPSIGEVFPVPPPANMYIQSGDSIATNNLSEKITSESIAIQEGTSQNIHMQINDNSNTR
jgi:hypothetical protein